MAPINCWRPTVRTSGTNCSFTTTVLLPVARIPEVCHTSTTSTASRGNARNRVSNLTRPVDERVHDHPVGVLDAGRPLPSAAQLVAAGDGRRRARGVQGCGRPAPTAVTRRSRCRTRRRTASTASCASPGTTASTREAGQPDARIRVLWARVSRPRPSPPSDVGTTIRNRSASIASAMVASGSRRSTSPSAARSASDAGQLGAARQHRVVRCHRRSRWWRAQRRRSRSCSLASWVEPTAT